MRRRQRRARRRPRLGAQVFEDEPRGRDAARAPSRRRSASGSPQPNASTTTSAGDAVGERLGASGARVTPAARLRRRCRDRRPARSARAVARSSIHSVTSRAVLGGELPREPPADAGVAEVVDDLAEDVPAAAMRVMAAISHGRAARRIIARPIAPRRGIMRHALACEATMTMPRPRLTIDVISDVVCPWCFIGKRRLEAALAPIARARARLPAARALASVPAQSRPAARGHRPARVSSRRSSADRERAAQIYERVRAAGTDGRHRVRVRAHRAPAQHARRASADLVGAGARRRRTRWSSACSARTSSKAASSAIARCWPTIAARGGLVRRRARAYLDSGRRRRRRSQAMDRARARARHHRRAVLHLRRTVRPCPARRRRRALVAAMTRRAAG